LVKCDSVQINKKEAGKRIKEIRLIDLDMSQKEFAQKLGTTQSMISFYEKGEITHQQEFFLR